MLRTERADGDTRASRLLALKKRHDDLEHKIDGAFQQKSISDFYLAELKKQKLHLKDMIEQMVRGDGEGQAAAG